MRKVIVLLQSLLVALVVFLHNIPIQLLKYSLVRHLGKLGLYVEDSGMLKAMVDMSSIYQVNEGFDTQ